MHASVIAEVERTTRPMQSIKPASTEEPRWDLAFLGVLGYLVVEYSRLPAAYPFLQSFALGKVVVGIAVLGWFLSYHKTTGDRSPVRAIDAAFVLLLIFAGFSVLFAQYKNLAWAGYIDLVRWAAIYFVIGRTVSTSWRFRWFISLLLLLNLKLAQHAVRYFYATLGHWDSAAVAVREGARAGSTGFFANSGDFGVAMCVVWPLATILLLPKSGKVMRIFLLTCSAVFMVAIVLSSSRGAVLGAACVIFAGIMASRKRKAAIIMALLLVVGITLVMPDAMKMRFQSALDPQQDRTAKERLQFWRSGLTMFRDNPILGVGITNFAPVRLEKYTEPGDTERIFVCHSIYMQVLSELGLAGVIPFLILIFLFFRLNARSRKILLALGYKGRQSYEYCLSFGLDLALIGYLTSGAFLAVLYYPHLWILLGLSVGLYSACCRIQSEARET
jgi:putative inorganic carbon (HCO3(-)) transporter